MRLLQVVYGVQKLLTFKALASESMAIAVTHNSQCCHLGWEFSVILSTFICAPAVNNLLL